MKSLITVLGGENEQADEPNKRGELATNRGPLSVPKTNLSRRNLALDLVAVSESPTLSKAQRTSHIASRETAGDQDTRNRQDQSQSRVGLRHAPPTRQEPFWAVGE